MEINKIHAILGMSLSVYYEHTEIIKNFMILSVGIDQCLPPFDHFVYSFEARCALSDFHGFNFMDRGAGPSYNSPPKFHIEVGENIPFYIDTYEVRHQPVGYAPISNCQFPPHNQDQEIFISGHFDSRDFEGEYNSTPERSKKKKPEPINSRFDILDL
jgi:hypothetical protein